MDRPHFVKLTMDLSDDPGSPRKKLKYEAPFFDGSAMDISSTDENVTTLEGNIVPTLTTMDHTLETEAQQKPPNTPTHHSLPATKASKNSTDGMTSLISTSESADEHSNKEKACGITEFVSSSVPGFSGVLKKRYTDFLVNEILPSGEVVHLTSLKPLKKEKPSNDVAKKTLHEAKVEKEVPNAVETPEEERRAVEKGVDFSTGIHGSRSVAPIVAKEDDRGEVKHEGEGSEKPEQGENNNEEVSEYRLECGDDMSMAALNLSFIMSSNAVPLDCAFFRTSDTVLYPLELCQIVRLPLIYSIQRFVGHFLCILTHKFTNHMHLIHHLCLIVLLRNSSHRRIAQTC